MVNMAVNKVTVKLKQKQQGGDARIPQKQICSQHPSIS